MLIVCVDWLTNVINADCGEVGDDGDEREQEEERQRKKKKT